LLLSDRCRMGKARGIVTELIIGRHLDLWLLTLLHALPELGKSP
jgi:hypothetical protein